MGDAHRRSADSGGRHERRRCQGPLPYRRAPGPRRERHTRRLRLGHLDGFDHRRHVCRRLFPRRDAGNRRFGSGQGVGLGPHSRQLPALLPGDQPHPLVHHHPAQPEQAGRGRKPVPAPLAPALLHADRPGPDRPLRGRHGSGRPQFRFADGPFPLRGQRYELPPPGRDATGRPGRSRPLLDVDSAGFPTRRDGFDAALRRRHLQQFPLADTRRGVLARPAHRQ